MSIAAPSWCQDNPGGAHRSGHPRGFPQVNGTPGVAPRTSGSSAPPGSGRRRRAGPAGRRASRPVGAGRRRRRATSGGRSAHGSSRVTDGRAGQRDVPHAPGDHYHHGRHAEHEESTATPLRAGGVVMSGGRRAMLPAPRRKQPGGPLYPIFPMARPTYWRAAEPRRTYDVVIVGGGGRGLSPPRTTWPSSHGITDVCVVEKGWLAGGNMARNTTVDPLELPVGRELGDLRALAEALGGARGGPGLRPPVQPARRLEPRPLPRRRPLLDAAPCTRTA